MNKDIYIKEYEKVLAKVHPEVPLAAKIRALAPLIIQNLADGATYKIIISELAQVEVTIGDKLLKKYLYLYRKANNQPSPNNTSQPTHTGKLSKPASAKSNPNKSEFVKSHSVEIENPNDLRNVRDVDIDLDSLRRAEQARRKSAKDS